MDNKESNITSRRSATVAAKAAGIAPATAVPVTASAPTIATATPVSAAPVCVCVSPPSFVSVNYSQDIRTPGVSTQKYSLSGTF
jgi:hypothetical protein